MYKYILFTNSNEVQARNVEILLNFNNDAAYKSSLHRLATDSEVPAQNDR